MSRTELRIIVQKNAACMRLLKWVKDNTKEINQAGGHITITLLTNDVNPNTLAQLKKKGIIRLPALIIPGKPAVIGTDLIIDKLSCVNPETASRPASIRYDPSNLEDYHARIMDDESSDEQDDDCRKIQDRLAAYERSKPAHRRAPSAAPPSSSRRKKSKNPAPPPPEDEDDDMPENVGDAAEDLQRMMMETMRQLDH